ncbi:uncharacterized protein K460DRAFT_388558 [Cucurbitaria berberidis CBS 394.84]|uniref:DUF7730 domain-containing protein n=1 Tax=Cucurbitaria berberidis CBS 394.84 TaxID=1168544 RepID=A0A9P4G9Y3_9PLEO|nr:uncharacterized protein K460DRAFT_388558 [Cucurbitaria berberidis CBS 394.84]KAF1841679.1 hypothetical protein K460DRAFT_388558 [Cucurbitaria berberidis CBS 394.84]
MAKRTYSQRDKRQSTYGQQSRPDHSDSRKRYKTDDSDELRLPPSPPPSRGEKTSSLLKKTLKAFGGPISVPEPEMIVDSAPQSSNRLAVFDKVLKERFQASKQKQQNIYGSREDFEETRKSGKKWKQPDPKPRNGHLPTPPAEIQRQAHQEPRKSHMMPTADSRAVGPATKRQTSFVPTETSRLFEKVIKNEQPKLPYEPKVYKDERTPAPRRTILGHGLLKKSKEAQMWSANQSTSQILQLPKDVRKLIFEYVLGGNTINVGFETYRATYKSSELRQVVPIFRYHCTVFDKRTNPFKQSQQPYVNVSTGFTLLNNVCRQMYLETATLPFKHNLISFGSHNIMFNFLFMEKRVSCAQLDAITQLVLPDALPQPNMLIYLRNLEQVFLAVDQDFTSKGWFRVVRREGEEPKLVNIRYASY